MSISTVDTAPSKPASTPRFNRWDSPWFNPKFLIGLSMVLFVMLMGVVGPFFWDETLARVASSPQNLPPPWAPGYGELAVRGAAPVRPEVVTMPTRRPTAVTTAQTDSPTATTGRSSITGGNPFAAQPTAAAPSTGSGSITGGNPFAAQPAATAPTTGGGSVTGGNPFATQAAPPAQSATTTDAAAAPAPAQPAAPAARSNPYGFGAPSWDHPLGTESNGRDMLAVLIVGAPRSLRIGLIAAGIGMLVGIALGFTAGFMGGWVDNVIRTFADAFITIPALAVLIVISAYVRTISVENMALMLALFAWPGPTRLIRSQVLTLRERGYVQMARLSGASTPDIMFREMMPNLLPYLAASFTGNVSGAILAATGLEALGLGPTRIPTLGMTIFYAIRAAAILRGMWWWWGFPILLLVIIFTGLFLMTIGLDEIANPRLRGAQQQ
ncbi:MAG: ABC transporter permease [Caldilineaceae bacterium]|nr:ABC transporter permease [Caldilineaceae bacterium]